MPILSRQVLAAIYTMFPFGAFVPAALLSHRAAAAAVSSCAWPQLRFTPQGTFQMTVFNDLHFGEAEDTDWGPLQDVDTLLVMETVLKKESPQLVVINGDFITGENTFKKNSTDYVDKIVSPVVARHLPWASTYGNHDSAYNLSSDSIYAREKTYKNSLTKKMVQNKNAGVSNYYLEVMSNNKRDSTPAMILWFFDSRGGNYYQEEEADGSDVARPNWVDQSVVDWFVATRAQLNKRYKKAVPSFAFVHIPVGAMYSFQQEKGVNELKEPGINADNPLSQQGVQSPLFNATASFEYTGQDRSFMKALLDTQNLMGVFSGHDHGDDWCFKWNKDLKFLDLTGNGLVFCFGRHTGYGGYGSWTRGSRQIRVNIKDLGKSTKTWTRLEDGTTVGAVTLNSTYGKDVYSPVEMMITSEDNEGVPSTTN
ncbi:Metallo-dependent phosphatase-like protein [Trichoderma barbatum]